MKCTICGAENLEGAAYCEDCGSKLPTSPPPEMEAEEVVEVDMSEEEEAEPAASAEGPVNCPVCGAENPGDSKFCDECGASLEEVEAGEDEGEEEEPPETPTGMAKLVSEDYDKEFVLDKDVTTLGRQSPADGIFPEIDLTEIDEEAYVSRRHARIIRKDDGFIFEDMGSSNGSFINNVRIAQGVQQFLNEGDVIRLGKTVLHFVK